MRCVFLVLLFAGLGLSWAGAQELPGLHEPLVTVTQQYLVVERKLAASSFDGVPAAAAAMKAAMAGAPTAFEPDFVQAVNQLAAAPDLHTARLAFQGVSNGLIGALAENKAQTGVLHSAFCPMIKAYWVQTDPHKIENPYYGPAMLDCGEIQRQF
jgi:hypothetical protein